MKNSVKIGIAAAIAVIAIAVGVVVALPALSSGKAIGGPNSETKETLRIGYFPNINHAQAVIGLGNGDFQKALGDNVEVKPLVFNAGPSAIEGLFANQVDVTFVGPNPAINGYVQSNGQALRIISGAASGGAVFVVRNDAGIESVGDFANKKFASPQLGNTQDVALRTYLIHNGYKTKDKGGNVEVLPAKNPDILTLMIKKDIDGAWVPEPWGATMVKQANAKILVDERDLWTNGDFVTAHIIARTDYLEKHPDVIKKLLTAHIDETNWINEHPDEARDAFNAQLKKLTGQTIDKNVYDEGFSRLKLTYDPIKESLFKSADDAYKVGFFDKTPDLKNIYDLSLLNEVLKEKGLPEIN